MLKTALDKYRLLLESLPDAFCCFKIASSSSGKPLDGVFLEINAAFEKLTGQKRAELLGRGLSEIIPADQDIFPTLLKYFGQVASTGEPSRFEIFCKSNSRWLDYTVYRFEPHAVAALIRDVTDVKNEDLRNRYLSYHDSLTGLYNRHFLETEMRRLDTSRQLPISIIVADINGLKLINDAFGYSEGDKLIRNAASVFKETCRSEDIITRWGGDEFMVLLPQTSPEVAGEISERISSGCNRYNVNKVPFTISIGSAAKTQQQERLEDVLKVAEEKMYRHKLDHYRETKGALLKSVYRKLKDKSFETEAHIKRVRNLSLKVGEKLELPKQDLNRLAVLVLLHDIGKVKILEDILLKKGLLENEEWETIKKHPEAGCRIARATEEFAYVADDILCHHEHWDGSGYPRGLKGEEIPLLSRIMAIADAFDVMTCGRPYRQAISFGAAINELKRCAGTQFDPQLVDLFIVTLNQN